MNDLSQYRLIIFDVDGTLRRCTIPGQPCPNKDDEWELMPGVKEKLTELDAAQINIGLASNQAGIAQGYITYDQCVHLIRKMCFALEYWPLNGAVQLCPHAIDEGCICRKPSPGMLYAIMNATGVYRARQVLYVGDMESDQECAARAGVSFMWAKDFFGWNDEP